MALRDDHAAQSMSLFVWTAFMSRKKTATKKPGREKAKEVAVAIVILLKPRCWGVGDISAYFDAIFQPEDRARFV